MRLPPALLLVLLISASARAEGPAVSELNGKFAVEAGTTGTRSTQSAVGLTQGTITTPLGHSFGLQVDGVTATAYGYFTAGGAAQLFWRDPAIGLAGPFAAVAGGNGRRLGFYGGQAELYAPVFTLAARGGYADASSAFGYATAGFYSGALTVYPVPNLALTIEGSQLAGVTLGRARIEYQPDLLRRRNLSFYANGIAGDFGMYRVTAGIQIYFGPDKPLIRRHREDDPAVISTPEIQMTLNPLAGVRQRREAPDACAPRNSFGIEGCTNFQ